MVKPVRWLYLTIALQGSTGHIYESQSAAYDELDRQYAGSSSWKYSSSNQGWTRSSLLMEPLTSKVPHNQDEQYLRLRRKPLTSISAMGISKRRYCRKSATKGKSAFVSSSAIAARLPIPTTRQQRHHVFSSKTAKESIVSSDNNKQTHFVSSSSDRSTGIRNVEEKPYSKSHFGDVHTKKYNGVNGKILEKSLLVNGQKKEDYDKGGPLRVLFLSSDTGGGHRASAESLAKQVRVILGIYF